jgi:uncharacterized membrane protein
MPSSQVEDFLKAADEQEVVKAIREAERNTSGEIRVHIERHTEEEPMKHAQEVFHWLKMDNTKLGNGVLIYVAVEDRSFVIYGDHGINAVVPNDFWNRTRDVMQEHFKQGRFKQGLVEGVLMAGAELEKHFPWHNGDKNELSDEISKSKP